MIARKYDAGENSVESQFIDRLKEYDERAWREMFERFDSLVYRMAQERLHSSQIPDLMQDVRMGLYQTINRYDPSKAALVTWVMLLTRRKCIDYLRKNGRTEKYSPLEDLKRIAEPSKLETDSETLEAVNQSIETLPLDQQKAFYLVFKRGFTLARTAEELQTPLGTIKTWIHRGVATVKEKIERKYPV